MVVLVLAGLLVVLERCHTYSEPLERDITTYAVIGSELLKGRALYSDLWDHKPPAIHVTFALAEAVAGEGPLAVFLLNLLAALATLAALFKAGKTMGGTTVGLWAALIWAVVCGDLTLQANQPNEEIFINALQSWAFVLWLGANGKKLEPRRWFLIGALLAAASLYKPFAVLELLLLSAAALILNWKPLVSRKRVLRQTASASACVPAVWALVFGWFALQGRWGDFKDAVFTYNLHYSGTHAASWTEFLEAIGGQALDFSTLAWLLLLFAVGCLGAFWGKKKKEERGPWLYWGAFLVAAELEVLLPGRFFAHYDQLLLPPLILGAAWGLASWGERIRNKKWKYLPGAVLLAFLVAHEAPFYALSPEEWAIKKYADGPLFLKSYELGRVLDEGLKPGESFYEWGNESELYFASHRSPPSGVFYSYPLLDNPLANELSQRVVTDLEREKPEVIVLNMTYYASPDLFHRHPVLQWILENYRPLPQGPYREPFLLVMRKGGNLEKRLTTKDVSPRS